MTKASMDEIAARSDVVSVHVPLLPETPHCINAAFLAKMKPSAYLISTSCGGVVDERALIQTLRDEAVPVQDWMCSRKNRWMRITNCDI